MKTLLILYTCLVVCVCVINTIVIVHNVAYLRSPGHIWSPVETNYRPPECYPNPFAKPDSMGIIPQICRVHP